MKIRRILETAALLACIALPMAAASITTTFAGGNGFTGNMFNATIGLSAVTVNSLGVNVPAGPVTIEVFIKPGTFVGFETNPAAWTLVSTNAVTGVGVGSATNVVVTPFTLSAGTSYGIYVTTTTPNGTSMFYTDGTNTYSNADLSLSLGTGIGGLFGDNGVIASRIWNGTINYTLATTLAPEPAAGWATAAGLALMGAFLRRRRS
jgi:hypothetical protein